MQEAVYTAAAGGIEQLIRRALLDNLPLLHKQQAPGDIAGKAHLMGNDQHCERTGGKVSNQIEDVAAQLRVKDEVGSSSNSACGSRLSARAMPIRCCCPPESVTG